MAAEYNHKITEAAQSTLRAASPRLSPWYGTAKGHSTRCLGKASCAQGEEQERHAAEPLRGILIAFLRPPARVIGRAFGRQRGGDGHRQLALHRVDISVGPRHGLDRLDPAESRAPAHRPQVLAGHRARRRVCCPHAGGNGFDADHRRQGCGNVLRLRVRDSS